ncbi:MAG TPA: TetR/AcrR family transcriptional regulator [Steroidobacteraceae bacterium]|jgi:AcrR family transcriptional regulator|nr:TetR/AcrR family transcriptional regulator [Steroidobacteraceae bacterium]
MQATAPVLPAARGRILDAAEQLVADQGASSLTLDAVAQAAGVSKGGLLYHYPNKDALLAAMIERHCDDLDERCARELEGLPADQPSSRLKASILGVLTPRAGREDVGAALLAAAANKPALLDGARARYAEHVAQLTASGGCFARSAVIMLAVDGLMLGEVWRLTPFTSEQRDLIVKELLRLADEACPELSPR